MPQSTPSSSPFKAYITLWLRALIVGVFVMIAIGGYTRLSGSGLSMTNWHPISGILPPLTETAWQAEFQAYQASPEFKYVNTDMALAGFKKIFWVEYIHRIAGRTLGLLFFLPFFFFWIKGAFTSPEKKRYSLIGLLLLGQGGMGWIMVKSGLVHNPQVSPYKLLLHFTLAIVLLSALMWAKQKHQAATFLGKTKARTSLRILLGLSIITLIYGALVAGHKAGYIYNSFPLMGGSLLPLEAWDIQPLYLNFVANPVLVQFMHRVLAVMTACFGLLVSFQLYKSHHKQPALFLATLLLMQITLGISTLVYGVPLILGVVHQLWAVVVYRYILQLNLRLG